MRYRAVIQALVVVIGASVWGWRHWRAGHSEPSYTMTSLTKDMKTLCIGRILMDVPAGTTWASKASWASVGKVEIASQTGVDRKQFEALVENRWRELHGLKTRSDKEPLHAPERTSPIVDSVVFSYGFRRVDGPDVYGVYDSRIFYDAQGFQWLDGTLVEFSPTLNARDDIIDVMKRTRARGRDEIPNQPGLCIDGAFIAGYYDLDVEEDMVWRFSLPRGLSVRVELTKVRAPSKSYFERDRESLLEWAGFIANAVKPGKTHAAHYYRKNVRNVGGLKGDEMVVGEVEGDATFGYGTKILGLWEYPGNGPAFPAPQISITMGAPRFNTTYLPTPAGGFPHPEDTPDGPLAEDFFEIWDAVIDSVRLRPIALAKPPLKAPPASRISPEQAERDRQSLDAFIASLPSATPNDKP